MNFGNPQKPEIMGQFAGAIMGMAEACRALDFPVVSGNVSLYNETEGRPILPTPTIGGVGVIDDVAKAVGSRFTQAGLAIVLLGETTGWLGQSLYLRETCGREEGAPPPVDLAVERRNGDFVRGQIVGRPRRRLPRPVRRRPAGGAGRDGLAGGTGVDDRSCRPDAVPAARLPVRRGPGPLSGRHRRSATTLLAAAQAAGVPAALLGYSGGADLDRRRPAVAAARATSGRPTKRGCPTYMNSAA